jgi:DNA helicase-2/ATP-dependent DNA helicase PcrA
LDIPSGDGDPWGEFEEADANRALFIRSIARAVAVARARDLAKAIQTLSQTLVRRGSFRDPLKFAGNVTDVLTRAVALEILEHVASHHDGLADGTLLEAYESIAECVEALAPGLKVTRITTGKPKAFAQSTAFGSLLTTVSLGGDESREVRSIHQAKGAESESICLYLPNAAQVSHILDPSGVDDDEERRITYVALSRARDRLVLCIPREHAPTDRLEALGFQVRSVS